MAASHQQVVAYTCDPLSDPRWEKFVERHSSATIFHTRGWVEALAQSYGYEPVVYTTSPPDRALTNGILACRIKSRLTGHRLVSLPFSDHCDLLLDRPRDREVLLAALSAAHGTQRLRYVELRPLQPLGQSSGFGAQETFAHHVLDLRPSLDKLFGAFHKDSIQRKIRRARREGLRYEEGTSEVLLEHFYGLMLMTRRRHGLPPQPLYWFQCILRCLGDRVKLCVAYKGQQPIGSILTLRFRRSLLYKYGCSDHRFHSTGVMPFLFSRTIAEAKAAGLESLDLGRSDTDQDGLITFKDRLGATSSVITYFRLPAAGGRARIVRRVPPVILSLVPVRLLAVAGRLIYRHIG